MQSISKHRYKLIKIGSVVVVIGTGLLSYQKFVTKPDSTQPLPTSNDDYIYLSPVVEGYDVDESEKRLRKSLNYLRFAKSRNLKLQNFCLNNLAKMKNLEDYHCRRIAMLCDFQSSCKLARIKDVDLRLFRPPLNIHLRRGDIFEILNDLYKAFPDSDCANFFALMAFRTKIRIKTVESALEDELRDNYLSKQGINLLCLQALIRYAMVNEKTCQLMIDKGLMACLLNLRDSFIDDFEINAAIVKLLSQLSQHKFSHNHFFSTGWIGILAGWLKPDVPLELRLPAAKILHNLDNDKIVLGNHLYLLHPTYSDKDYDYDVVFFHGLMGGVYRTWRQYSGSWTEGNQTRCWPQDWLPLDVPDLRIIAIDYHSSLFERKANCIPEARSLRDRAELLINELLKAGLGKRPIILIGHSMGGLLIKQILVNCHSKNDPDHSKLLDAVKGIVFYSVPHRGSGATKLSLNLQRILIPSQEIKDLIKDSPVLTDLHQKFISLLSTKKIDIISFGEKEQVQVNIKGVKVNALLVPTESSHLDVGEFHILNTNHFLTCKPYDQSSPSYTIVRDFIQSIIDKTSPKAVDPMSLTERIISSES
ncbi:protein SERAC1 [Tetranychus urticae]|uniref:GPI inositol-deacylase n=1 Tax=Tetranychus urticae TaxID=32264 RepID=T1KAY6_TETUR|nr:protein SERAC1 [Tetranychus urticae]